MTFPDDLFYTESHEWLSIKNDEATIGITDYAQSELGDIIFVELPAVGKNLDAEQAFGSIEAVKTVSDLYTPVAGVVTAINESLQDQAEVINSDPYGKGWIIKLKMKSPSTEGLLKAGQYKSKIGQ
jgi:glycine cleavage system H protein